MPDIPLPKPQPPVPPQTITPPPGLPTVPPAPVAPKAPTLPTPAPAKPPAMAKPAPAPVPTAPSVKPPAAPSNVAMPPRPPMPNNPPGAIPKPAPVVPAPANANNAAPKAASAGSDNKPKLAIPDGPIKKFLPFIIGGVVLLLLAIGAFAIFGSSPKSTPVVIDSTTNNTQTGTTSDSTGRQTVTGQKTQLTYWGLWETNAVLDEVFSDFEAANPGVEIVYQKQSHVDYRQRLQTAIASGNGPDVFRFHDTWVPMLSNELAVMPTKVMSVSDYQKTFYPVAFEQLQVGGQIVGIPLMYDGLALYYNKNVLETAGEQPPTTWTELKTLASKLTIKSGDDIKRSGLAIGNASTTEHFSDIIGLLMLQNGADPKDLTSKEAQEALIFYTNFVTRDKVWNDKLPSSTVAFARGDAAMMIAPSWRAHEVMAVNPNLDFGIVSMPTLGNNKITWASFWAEGVSNKSKNKDIAWELLKYLSSKEVMQKMYSSQAQTRSFGEIYSRVDLANSLANDPYAAPFLADAPYAKSWYLSSYTHDKGLNDNMIKYYTDAVNALITGKDIEKVIEPLSLGSQQILRQYSVR